MPLAVLVLTLAQAASPAAAPLPTPQPTPPPQTRPHPSGPYVALDVVQGRTPIGTITIGLDAQKAPLSVENFLAYVRSGHYDGTIFHRVMPGFMIQGGGYTPELEEKPTRPPIPNEARNGLRNSRGTVAMARLDSPNSATSQFFINLRDNHRLDFGIGGAGYAVFGLVVDGMDVVDRIATVPTSARGQHENVPQTSVLIRSAREVPPPAAAPPVPDTAGAPTPRP
jgi:peptidyl-prolyl cis-trans isomerase A (cyclophilin A)